MFLEYQRTHSSADTLMSFSEKMSRTCVGAGSIMENKTEAAEAMTACVLSSGLIQCMLLILPLLLLRLAVLLEQHLQR